MVPSLWKVPFMLAVALFYDRSFVPPTLPASLEEQRRVDTKRPTIGWYESIAAPVIVPWIRIVYWAFTITETFTILTAPFHTHTWPSDNVLKSGGQLTITFMAGAGLIAAGGTLRFRCFKEMGRHFTFALSLRDHHQLIVSGPYAVVRHPAYTGGNMMIAGAALTLLGDGSWWFESGYSTSWGKLLAFNFLLSSALIVRGFFRGSKEDFYLKKLFGQKWEEYAHNVPYRYLPGVY